MKCPYCKQEMQAGYINNASQPVQWIPDGKKPSRWKFSYAEHGVTLSGQWQWKGYNAESFYCADCRVVITPVAD